MISLNTLLRKFHFHDTKVHETEIEICGCKIFLRDGKPYDCEVPSCWSRYINVCNVLTWMGADNELLNSLRIGYVLAHRRSIG